MGFFHKLSLKGKFLKHCSLSSKKTRKNRISVKRRISLNRQDIITHFLQNMLENAILDSASKLKVFIIF